MRTRPARTPLEALASRPVGRPWSARLALSVGLAALALTVFGPSAVAQGPEREQARALATEATAAYDDGRYQVALELYQQAYGLFPAAGLLFNLGQCHRELGQPGLAAEHYARYLEERPEAQNRETVESLLAEARRAHEAEERERAEREAEQARLREATEELALARAALERERASLQVIDEPPPAALEIHEEWWFWTIVVGALLAVGVGIGLGVHFGQPGLPSGSLGTVDAR